MNQQIQNQAIAEDSLREAFKREAEKAYDKLSDFTNKLIEQDKVPVQFMAAALSRELSITTAILILSSVGDDRQKAVELIEGFGQAMVEGTIEIFDDILANSKAAEQEEAQGQAA